MTIVIGISSGIAAYKTVELIRNLKERNLDVQVIMTEHAVSMVKKDELEKVSGNRVFTQLFPYDFNYKTVLAKREVEHITLASKTSLFVVAPATANIVGKIASGIADDFLTTTLLATTAPILICPSMNTYMWHHPIVQENIKKLKRLGYFILDPKSGRLACGYEGIGRLADITEIENEIYDILYKKNSLKGKKILITAGGTTEPIDPVRFISNRSSGKMGIAIATESYLRGADVLLLRAKNSISTDYPIRQMVFETMNDLENLIRKNIKNFSILFHTAAIADFVPDNVSDKKLDSRKTQTLHLQPTRKILNQIKKLNPEILLVGFKAVYKMTDTELIAEGIEKLKESQADYIIVNDVGREGVGFAEDTNEVYIISADKPVKKIHKTSKKKIAKQLLNNICT